MSTAFYDSADNAVIQIATTGQLNNTTTPVTISVTAGDDTKFSPVANNYPVTIWDKTTYADPKDDPQMEKAFVTAVDTTGHTLTITRANPKTHAGQPYIGNLWRKAQYDQICDAINAVETGTDGKASLTGFLAKSATVKTASSVSARKVAMAQTNDTVLNGKGQVYGGLAPKLVTYSGNKSYSYPFSSSTATCQLDANHICYCYKDTSDAHAKLAIATINSDRTGVTYKDAVSDIGVVGSAINSMCMVRPDLLATYSADWYIRLFKYDGDALTLTLTLTSSQATGGYLRGQIFALSENRVMVFYVGASNTLKCEIYDIAPDAKTMAQVGSTADVSGASYDAYGLSVCQTGPNTFMTNWTTFGGGSNPEYFWVKGWKVSTAGVLTGCTETQLYATSSGSAGLSTQKMNSAGMGGHKGIFVFQEYWKFMARVATYDPIANSISVGTLLTSDNNNRRIGASTGVAINSGVAAFLASKPGSGDDLRLLCYRMTSPTTIDLQEITLAADPGYIAYETGPWICPIGTNGIYTMHVNRSNGTSADVRILYGVPIGLATADAAAAATAYLATAGIVSGFSGLTVGATYYALGDGSLSATWPTEFPVGVAVSDTEIEVYTNLWGRSEKTQVPYRINRLATGILDNAISDITVSATPTQAEVVAIKNAVEKVADYLLDVVQHLKDQSIIRIP